MLTKSAYADSAAARSSREQHYANSFIYPDGRPMRHEDLTRRGFVVAAVASIAAAAGAGCGGGGRAPVASSPVNDTFSVSGVPNLGKVASLNGKQVFPLDNAWNQRV